ncbi:hypothetical protein EDB85DRAFT_1902691 [Lactarius pseudohatsudake]|nr:hypothetical protein EDB85DRAFT_1902691 [Lactarius pseudohatsudake]
MASQELVFCICCNKRIPRRLEREHRSQARDLKLLTTPMSYKRPRLAFKATHTPCDKPAKTKPISKPLECQDMCSVDPGPDTLSLDVEMPGPLTPNGERGHYIEGSGQVHDTDQLLVATMSRRWHQGHNHLDPPSEPDEDSGEDSNVPLKDGFDSDESDVIDRDVLDQESGFSIRNELGEDFESRYANIGESY